MVGQWLNIFLMRGLNGLKTVDKFDVMSVNEKCLIGYLLEIGIKNHDEVH